MARGRASTSAMSKMSADAVCQNHAESATSFSPAQCISELLRLAPAHIIFKYQGDGVSTSLGLIPTNSISLQTCWSRIKTRRLRSRSTTNHRSVTGRGQVIISCRHWHTVNNFIMIHMLFSSLIECDYR